MEDDKEITEKELLLDYHEAFFKLCHVPLDWTTKDLREFTICGKEHCNPLCVRVMEQEEGGCLCKKMSHDTAEEGIRTRKPVVRKCHAGLYDAFIPIFVESRYIGSLCVGQYLLKQPTAAEIRETLKRLSFLNLTEEELRGYYRKTQKFTKEEAEGLIELVQKLAEYICESYGRLQFFKSVSRADAIQTAEQYIQNHYASKLTVSSIARAVGLSSSYFLHKFTEQTGDSPMAYLNRYRVEKAADLLKNSELNISEIAYIVGFTNVVTFNRNFVKYNAMSPTDYRNKYRKGNSRD